MMKRHLILIVLLILPLGLSAQKRMSYNRKGDYAMARLDYSDARMWYEEGAAQCDPYSVGQLTKIWLASEEMRPSMKGLMIKCFNCLNVMANDRDTTAISLLVVYYTEGIGIPKNEELAENWMHRLEASRKPLPAVSVQGENSINRQNFQKKESEPMQFFAGYLFSPQTPFGLTVGGVKSNIGWFVRLRSNLSFDNYTGEIRGKGDFTNAAPKNQAFYFTNKKKTGTHAGTAGVVIKWTPQIFTLVGLGYGSRELLCEYKTVDNQDHRQTKSYWAKNLDYSYNGLAADLDMKVKFGQIFISAGCNTLNFKYVDLNAGIGMFF